jgi:hypothetical protein
MVGASNPLSMSGARYASALRRAMSMRSARPSAARRAALLNVSEMRTTLSGCQAAHRRWKRRDLRAPALEISPELRELPGPQELDHHERVYRAHIRWDVARLADVRESDREAMTRALVAEDEPRLRQRAHATRVPERAARKAVGPRRSSVHPSRR